MLGPFDGTAVLVLVLVVAGVIVVFLIAGDEHRLATGVGDAHPATAFARFDGVAWPSSFVSHAMPRIIQLRRRNIL